MNTNTTPVVAERDGLEVAFESYNATLAEQEAYKEQITTNKRIWDEFSKGPDKHAVRVTEIKTALAVELTKIGLVWTVSEPKYIAGTDWRGGWQPGQFINNKGGVVDMYTINLEISRIRSHTSSWRSHETNQYQIIFGDYGNKTRFPQKKDGSFSYDKIAATMKQNIEAYNARIKANNKEQAAYKLSQTNRVVREAVAKTLGISEYRSDFNMEGSKVEAGKVFVSVKFNKTCSEEEAVALFNALVAAGFIKKEDR